MVYCVLVCWLRMTSSCICVLCHLFGVHDLYRLYRYYLYVFWLACEVYRSSRSRHKNSNRYFSFCQKKSRFFCSFLNFCFYTRIFLITSPYRSFFIVMFFPLRRNQIIMSIGPKNPNQLSVERENGDDDSGVAVRSEILTPVSPDTVVGITVVVVSCTSSMRMSEMRSMSPPSPVITHLQIHFLTIPGSRSPRTSPMAGKR